MPDLNELLTYLPQKAPVGFVTEVLVSEEHLSRTVVVFGSTPTLPMLSEAGAQTSIFLRLTKEKLEADVPARAMGMLVSVKSKWIERSTKSHYEVESRYVNNLDNFFVVDFTIYDGDVIVGEGQVAAVLQRNGESL